ncbi:MAG: gephyrin-like molybdotransferase Glp [Actinomycetota bacterium]|nr:gephyrin-like molybdotransferase Glp [Actinomycetota bacterium]MEC7590749.1 gephyrin-like molybdotransferase Glp [Actinomycetota bacterium]MEC8648031.1 gephyrin-like molybdotransferase Glp [Actinomycetota bacterium]MEE3088249.1 gephyrin-like molybdotransferase Glp [Actinomycetota bacterium]
MLVSVDDYREGILAGLEPLDPITLPLADSHGCVLAEDVVAQWPLPSFDNSSMDGYAVMASDVSSAAEASPVTLTVIDDVPAGSRADVALRPGCAVRIMTGAPIPSGTDCIVPVEVTDAGTDSVEIRERVAAGSYIRRAGEDVIIGDVVVRAGTLLSSRQLAVIAAVGKGHVVVYPRPRVAVLSTGSELVEPGTPLSKGMISDSNSFLLVSAANEAGAQAYRVPPVPDDAEAFSAAISDQLHRADLILTSGGVSMGAYDTVKEVFSSYGTVEFTKVAMHPGMPQGHGVVGESDDERIPVITLPGNPVSSYISFQNFVRPAINKLRGLGSTDRPRLAVEVTKPLDSPQSKRQFARGRFLDDGRVEPVGGGQGSHVIGGLAQADCLIVIPEGVAHVNAGDTVDVVDLRGDVG